MEPVRPTPIGRPPISVLREAVQPGRPPLLPLKRKLAFDRIERIGAIMPKIKSTKKGGHQ